jgi:hypothetical protein
LAVVRACDETQSVLKPADKLASSTFSYMSIAVLRAGPKLLLAEERRRPALLGDQPLWVLHLHCCKCGSKWDLHRRQVQKQL